MFNEYSIIHDVNVMNKLVCYLLVIVSLLVCSQPLFVVFVNMFLLLITKQFTNLWKMNLVVFGFSILCMIYPEFLWISKLGIFVIYTVLFKKVTQAVELRYVLENTLYRFQAKKITYRILYFIYFMKKIKNNMKDFLVLKDDYGMKLNISFLKLMIKESFAKTQYEMNEFMDMNKMRFYNFYKRRTYIEKVSFESWDTNYLVSHVMIMLLTCFYGR